jgi:hypothetical protein
MRRPARLSVDTDRVAPRGRTWTVAATASLQAALGQVERAVRTAP